jgi:hypothetical protein
MNIYKKITLTKFSSLIFQDFKYMVLLSYSQVAKVQMMDVFNDTLSHG